MGETSVDAKKASKKWLVWGVIALVLIIAVSWYLSLDKGGLKEGTVVIKEGDVILGSFTVADLKKLPVAEKKMTITRNCSSSCSSKNSGGGNQSKHDYTGTPLSAVLNSINPDLTQKYKKVITRGIDYYSQVMEMSEVQQPDNIYIAYSDYYKPLKTKAGEEGSLSLIVCSDKSGQRFTNWLVSLELQ
ncbi:MAG: molybdopterin-dependent oxidoreductase [Eubacteriales bacterium]|jgi:DMSO/TMAO reductase YedYZ molybdopterin-dependent catalytic subunit